MHSTFGLYIFLLFVILLLVMLAQRLKVSYPIVLVVGGLALSFVPGLPAIEIDPELIFVIFYRHCCMKQPGILPGKISGNGGG